MIINVDGQAYDITNWDEFSSKLLNAIGFSTLNEIRAEVRRMKLQVDNRYLRGFDMKVVGNELTIFNRAPYAVYLEYGTYEYWKRYGLTRWTDPLHPKKKDLTRKQREGLNLPKGGQPYAPVRRVLYNDAKMKRVIESSLKWADK